MRPRRRRDRSRADQRRNFRYENDASPDRDHSSSDAQSMQSDKTRSEFKEILTDDRSIRLDGDFSSDREHSQAREAVNGPVVSSYQLHQAANMDTVNASTLERDIAEIKDQIAQLIRHGLGDAADHGGSDVAGHMSSAGHRMSPLAQSSPAPAKVDAGNNILPPKIPALEPTITALKATIAAGKSARGDPVASARVVLAWVDVLNDLHSLNEYGCENALC